MLICLYPNIILFYLQMDNVDILVHSMAQNQLEDYPIPYQHEKYRDDALELLYGLITPEWAGMRDEDRFLVDLI